MIEKKPTGAPRGNQNARKHGFYSRVLNEAHTLQLDQAREVEGIDEEIAVIRVKLLTLMDQHPGASTFSCSPPRPSPAWCAPGSI